MSICLYSTSRLAWDYVTLINSKMCKYNTGWETVMLYRDDDKYSTYVIHIELIILCVYVCVIQISFTVYYRLPRRYRRESLLCEGNIFSIVWLTCNVIISACFCIFSIMHCQKNKLYWNSENPASFRYMSREYLIQAVCETKKAKIENY